MPWPSPSRPGLANLVWRPLCVLLDLPDGNGVEVLRHVLAERLPVRVAVTTAASDPEMLDAVRQLEPDAFFLKPVDFDAFRGCGSGRHAPELRGQTPGGGAPARVTA